MSLPSEVQLAAAATLTPSLHRRLCALGSPLRAWSVLAEILATVDPRTGLSLATACSIAAELRCARATVYRALRSLREAGIVEGVPLERGQGRRERVAFRVCVATEDEAER